MSVQETQSRILVLVDELDDLLSKPVHIDTTHVFRDDPKLLDTCEVCGWFKPHTSIHVLATKASIELKRWKNMIDDGTVENLEELDEKVRHIFEDLSSDSMEFYNALVPSED